jgi:hypothetical protein
VFKCYFVDTEKINKGVVSLRSFDGSWDDLRFNLRCSSEKCLLILDTQESSDQRIRGNEARELVRMANNLWELINALGANPNLIDGYQAAFATDPRVSPIHLGDATPFSNSTAIIPSGPHSDKIAAVYWLWRQTYALLFDWEDEGLREWYRRCLVEIIGALDSKTEISTLSFPALPEAPSNK